MKLYRNQHNIYGMAYPRKHVLPKMSELSEIISVHVIQCVVYKEIRFLTISHWVGELAIWMNRLNKLKCSSKLKKSDYVKTAFGAFGTTAVDAEINLSIYREQNFQKAASERYPNFDITDMMPIRLYNAYLELIDTSLPILMSNDVLTVVEWKQLLMPIFN